MRAWIIAGLALVAVAGAPLATHAQAPEQPAASFPTAVDQPSGSYKLDPRHASVLFRIRHMELAYFTARFDTRDGTLDLNHDDPAQSHFNFTVDVTSVNTGVLNAQGERSFDRSIGRALGGEAAQQATFTSTAIERTGAETARVTGDLALNGQTHPATFDVTFDGGTNDLLRGGSRVLGFSATSTIQRSQWGIREWRSFTGDDVQIVFEGEFVKS